MSPYQNLNENRHQNLNNLFYDIGWRVSKYVDGSQQIVPAANQLGTIAARPGLTGASRKPQCCSAASPSPQESQNRPRTVCLLRALSLLPLTHSRSQQLSPAKRTPRTFRTTHSHCPLLNYAGAVAVRLNYSARPTSWGQHPASDL